MSRKYRGSMSTTCNYLKKKKATINSQTPRYSADLIKQTCKNIPFTVDWWEGGWGERGGAVTSLYMYYFWTMRKLTT